MTLWHENLTRAYLIPVDRLLPQQLVVPGVLVEQTPVHLDVPGVGVAGAEHQREQPQPEEGVLRGRVDLCIDYWNRTSVM